MFAGADVVAGWLVVKTLVNSGNERAEGSEKKGRDDREAVRGMDEARAMKFASVWLLNPVVATISTRGSSEGLLGVMSAGLVWAVLRRKVVLAGLICGLGVHFKIYPFIYGTSILLHLEPPSSPSTNARERVEPASASSLLENAISFITKERITFTGTALGTFMGLNGLMYYYYGSPFLNHTFLHHLTRIDHRHNFSAYNTLLHLSSMSPESVGALQFHKVAFVPQLLLSAVLIPLVLAKKDLAGAMMCQTWAFVTFNKVVTSQVCPSAPTGGRERISIRKGGLTLLVFHLVPHISPFLPTILFVASEPKDGLHSGCVVGGNAGESCIGFGEKQADRPEALWLHRAYALEFLGQSTFFPDLFLAGLAFFAVNCWILGIMILDVGMQDSRVEIDNEAKKIQ